MQSESMSPLKNSEVALLERAQRESDEAAERAMREASRFIQLGRDIAEALQRIQRKGNHQENAA